MTSIVPTTDMTTLLTMPQVDVSKTTAQMTALLSEMASEKGHIDSMVGMLEKQPWYKKCIFTITGKNKATVAEIQQHKDKIASYTSSALAQLYENNKIEQQQIIFLGEAINSVNGQLAATNYELLKTQSAIAEMRSDLVGSVTNLATALDDKITNTSVALDSKINDVANALDNKITNTSIELAQSLSSLANALNEKITSVDNFHMLITEIEQGLYDYNNVIATLFTVIAQIDRRMVSDDRKMNILHNALTKKGYLNDEELPLFDYMSMVAKLPDNVAGTVYYEFFCLTGNDYANMFTYLIDSYTFLPKMERKAKKSDLIINGIFKEHNVDSDTTFTTNEIYDYFIEGKKDYLSGIQEARVVEVQAIASEADNAPEEKSFEWYKKAAEQGDVEAMFELGLCYWNGNGVEKDKCKAFGWWEKAAEKGHVKAQRKIGLCYENGDAVEKDLRKAFEWYKKSAEQGDRMAQCCLAYLYSYGNGVAQNKHKAFEWFRKSAEQDWAPAQFEVSRFYYDSDFVDTDEKLAFEWSEKAAKQGFAPAQYNLGLFYNEGIGVDVDTAKAFEWYLKAAEQDHAYAQFMVSIHFSEEAQNAVNDIENATVEQVEKRIDLTKQSLFWVQKARDNDNSIIPEEAVTKCQEMLDILERIKQNKQQLQGLL